VCWFTDGFEDVNGAIETELTTRGYFSGQRVLALRCDLNADTFNPSLTVTARAAGYNEEQTLLDAHTTDRTKYLVDGQADYDPDTSTTATYDVAHREDYSPGASELFVAKLDAHQNVTEHLRLRMRDRVIQIIVANTQGSVQINSVELGAKPIGSKATRES
jgi:hypothetical protein